MDPTSPWLAWAREIPAGEVKGCIEALNAGLSQWRGCSRPMRLAILAALWEEQWSKLSEFDRTRPAWMPTGGSVAFLSTDNRWSQIPQSISELRAPLSAMS